MSLETLKVKNVRMCLNALIKFFKAVPPGSVNANLRREAKKSLAHLDNMFAKNEAAIDPANIDCSTNVQSTL